MNYRANVAAILRNIEGKILVCERIRNLGAWQFPQGSVNKDESHEQALCRELHEEIGVWPIDYRIVLKKGPYRYGFSRGRNKKGFHGKEQHYFLCDFRSADSSINVQQPHPEFRDYRWIRPEEFDIAWLPSMKHEVYRAVLLDFFNVRI
ncbi:MAG: NUDIX domain-containing protein [Verrucomicrobiota bacterium]